MKYLDEDWGDVPPDGGDFLIRLDPGEGSPDRSDWRTPGDPRAVGIRRYHMAVTGLGLEFDDDRTRDAVDHSSATIRIIRGCFYMATIVCGELPPLAALHQTPPWRRSCPSPWPTYIFNPARQNLSFEGINLPGQVGLRVFYKRLQECP